MNKKDIDFRKKLYNIYALSGVVLYCVFIGIKLVGLNIASDILYKDTIIPLATSMLHDFTELVVMTLSYAVAIFSIYKFSYKGSVGAYVIYGALTLAKYLAGSSPMLNLMSGGGLVLNELAYSLIYEVLIAFVLEGLQYFIIVFISCKMISFWNRKYEISNASATRASRACRSRDELVYPFSRLFDGKNPILRSALSCGIVVIATRMLLTVEKCVNYIVSQAIYIGWDYTLENIVRPGILIDLPYMAGYFATDIFCGVICYFGVILLQMIFFDSYLKFTPKN